LDHTLFISYRRKGENRARIASIGGMAQKFGWPKIGSKLSQMPQILIEGYTNVRERENWVGFH